MGIDRNKRPVSFPSFGQSKTTVSTAASTALAPAGVVSLRSTSTGGPVVYNLASLPKAGGDALAIHAGLVGATSAGAGFHITAAANSFFGSSSEDMITMLGQGNGVLLLPVSSARWAAVGVNGATFSTST